MNDDRFWQIRTLFDAALEQPADAREAFVRERADADVELATQVLALLANEPDDTAALRGAAGPSSPPAVIESCSVGSSSWSEFLARLRQAGSNFERYEVGEAVASGGQGVIFEIRDRISHRSLAMKRIRRRPTSSTSIAAALDDDTLGRFLDEAQIQAQLDHPAIVPVHEIGLDDEQRVYFTMKFVRGQSLAEVCDRVAAADSEWPLARALRVVTRICEAMAYAHDKRVVHRDLKPDNVMVGQFGEVFVMDWGLARSLQAGDASSPGPVANAGARESSVRSERTRQAAETPSTPLLTEAGTVLGTPSYMPPEQARGRIDEVDERSDVYAVGAILYHLLAGYAPFQEPGVPIAAREIVDRVRAGPPCELDAAPGRPAALRAIVGRAMARDCGDRYATMSELGADLQAYLDGRVVQAHGGGAWQALRSVVRRHRALAVTIAGALIVAGTLTGTWLWRESQNAEANADLAYAYQIREAQRNIDAGLLEPGRRALTACDPGRSGFEHRHLQLQLECPIDVTPLAGRRAGSGVRASIEGRRLALVTDDQLFVVFRDVGGGRQIDRRCIGTPALSGNGRILAFLTRTEADDIELVRWDLESDREVGRTTTGDRYDRIALDGAGDRAISYGTGGLTLHDMSRDDHRPWQPESGFGITDAAMAADGSFVAFVVKPESQGPQFMTSGPGRRESTVRLWPASSPAPRPLGGVATGPKAVAFPPGQHGGNQLAILSPGVVQTWDCEAGELRQTTDVVAPGAMTVAVGGDGTIATAGPAAIRVIHPTTGRSTRIWAAIARRSLTLHRDRVAALVPRTDTWNEWSLDQDDGAITPAFATPGSAVRFAPDGRHFALTILEPLASNRPMHGGQVVVFDAATGTPKLSLPGDVVAFGPTGRRVVVGASCGRGALLHDNRPALTTHEVKCYDLDGDTERQLDSVDWGVNELAVSPDGQLVAGACGAVRTFPPGLQAEAAPSDDALLGCHENTIRLWHLERGVIAAATPHERIVTSIAFDAAGDHLFTAARDGKVLELRCDDLSVRRALVDDRTAPVRAVRADPRGELLAVGLESGDLLILDLASGAELNRLPHTAAIVAMTWSPDGSRLVTLTEERAYVRARDTSLLFDRVADAASTAVSADGRWLAIGATMLATDLSALGHMALGAENVRRAMARRAAADPDVELERIREVLRPVRPPIPTDFESRFEQLRGPMMGGTLDRALAREAAELMRQFFDRQPMAFGAGLGVLFAAADDIDSVARLAEAMARNMEFVAADVQAVERGFEAHLASLLEQDRAVAREYRALYVQSASQMKAANEEPRLLFEALVQASRGNRESARTLLTRSSEVDGDPMMGLPDALLEPIRERVRELLR